MENIMAAHLIDRSILIDVMIGVCFVIWELFLYLVLKPHYYPLQLLYNCKIRGFTNEQPVLFWDKAYKERDQMRGP